MGRKTLTITLPEPCEESWDVMRPVPGGRHCAACAKTVLDFSVYTDAELLDFFSKPASAGICCRLREDQLNRTITSYELPGGGPRFWQRAATVLLAVHVIAAEAAAQVRKRVPQTVQTAARKKAAPGFIRGKVNGVSPEYAATLPRSITLHLGDSLVVNATLDSSFRFRIPIPKNFPASPIRWEMQSLFDGIVLDGSAIYDEDLRAQGLALSWQVPVKIDAAQIVTPPYYRSFGGAPVPHYREAIPKPTMLKRMLGRIK